MADLGVEFCGLYFKNPIIVSSIEPTNSLERLKSCIDNGAAGAVVKTLTDIPSMVTLTKHSKYAILNETGEIIKGKIPRNFVFYSRSGFSSTPYGEWEKDLGAAQVYAAKNNAHIIASIGAGSPETWALISKMAEDCGVPLVELNLGCPHTSHMSGAKTGVRIGQVPELAAEVVGRVVAAVKIPVLVKLTPEAANLTDVAASVKQAGASAVTVNSRFTGFAVDIETGKPLIGGPAGVGGPWIKYVTLRWVHDIYSRLGMAIAGSNGIFDWRDAIAFIMSGARIMQVGSVLMLKGYEWLGQMIQGIEAFLEEHGYGSIGDIYGMASRNAAGSYDQQFVEQSLHAVVDDEACTRCWNCVHSCFYDALGRGEEGVIQHLENCIGCELCFNVCPFDAIAFAPNA
ncbi:MAG: tRNA-dihydrouridine synthase [Desulfobacteraceae bacterium]|nr:tRNA-dihydrouridine synthase [Desulfobacteraceae bacterium]